MSQHGVGKDWRETNKTKRYGQVVSLSFAWLVTSLALTSGKAVAITRRSLLRLASGSARD
jgi:hypothetical protein